MPVPSAAPSRPTLNWPFLYKTLFWLHLPEFPPHPCALSWLTHAARAASVRWMAASHATAIPSRVGFSHGDSSLIRFRSANRPNFGRRLQLFAGTHPLMPHGPSQGESLFDPFPLHPAPPGLPTMPNGSVDICALIPPQTTTEQMTRAGRLASRISKWAQSCLCTDGRQYEAQSRDGIVRAFPMPPGQLPRWHGPANLTLSRNQSIRSRWDRHAAAPTHLACPVTH